ncbi:hypothetical protein, partial [Flavobacterium sp. UBA6046]|uniref:hypothetical protein n=1 Tax=Flavobacterium sp. UBA6046 TaxID=1946552 RepID=UPI0025C337D9
MQNKITGVLITSLVVNLILIVALTGGAISLRNNNAQIQSLSSQKENLNQRLEQDNANNKTETLLTSQAIKNNISDFVNAEFNYTNENYISRFEVIKRYVTNDVYNGLKGTGDITTPKTKVQNEVTNLNVYFTTDDNKTIKALVNIATIYSIQGVKGTTINQIYELELREQTKDQWIITKDTLMGNFSP